MNSSYLNPRVTVVLRSVTMAVAYLVYQVLFETLRGVVRLYIGYTRCLDVRMVSVKASNPNPTKIIYEIHPVVFY